MHDLLSLMQVGNSNLVYMYVPRLTMHSSTRFRLTASPRPIQIPKRAHQLHHVRRDPPVLSLVSGAQQVSETVNPEPSEWVSCGSQPG